MTIESLLIVKIIVSVGVVLFLSYIAEAVSSKWAGIISGLPTGSAITLYFYAYENGTAFASESAVYNMIGLLAMQAFIYGYYFSGKIFRKPGILMSTIFGLTFYCVVSVLITYFTVTPSMALILCPISFVFFIKLFRDIEVVDIKAKVKLTKKILLLRSLISSAIIVSITSIAYLVGSQWSGLFSAFPTTLFPLIVILHMNYGKNLVDSVIKYVPQGLGGLLIYSFVIHWAYKSSGINIGVLLAFMGTGAYLFIFSIIEKRLKSRLKS